MNRVALSTFLDQLNLACSTLYRVEISVALKLLTHIPYHFGGQSLSGFSLLSPGL